MARRVVIGRATFAAALLLLAAPAPSARAHAQRTAYVEIRETAPGVAFASLRPGDPGAALALRPTDGCRVEPLAVDATPGMRAYSIHCTKSLAGHAFRLVHLDALEPEAVIRIALADGRHTSRIATVREPEWSVPLRLTWIEETRSFARAGIAHVASGFDHLLFLLALVLYAGRARTVMLAESAFTLAHTVTFSLASLGLVRVSALGAEAAIALSLVCVALDLGRSEARSPAAARATGIAFLFGLVHGLGFAGGLSDLGLPQHAIASALAGFAAGLEVAQLGFVLAVLALVALARRLELVTTLETGAAYVVGGIGAYWLLERAWRCVA